VSERVIQAADLSRIANVLSSVEDSIHQVSRQVQNVDDAVTITRGELSDLRDQLQEFEERYERSTEVSVSETRLVKVRQELEQMYGHHNSIRRAALGLLQASDIRIVRQDTVDKVTEELMLLAPKYWLAPALVALSAWLRDDKSLAERALAEALRRDNEKTSLFFALVTRRAQRAEACAQWMQRYLDEQNPVQLRRETIVLVEATASGVFAPMVQQACISRFKGWIEKLKEKDSFVEDQRVQWRDALTARIRHDDQSSNFPYLSKYSPTWKVLQKTLNRAKLNASLLDYFKGIVTTPLPSPLKLVDAVDAQLINLVSNHDAEELPLRRAEALLQLIIDNGGRRKEAEVQFKLEHKALDETFSFTQLLTNAAMNPKEAGASIASQRLALALSREWIAEAHADMTLKTRSEVPSDIAIEIDSWSGKTTNGGNEHELLASLDEHLERAMKRELDNVRIGVGHWIAGILGGVLIFSFLWWGWFGTLIGLGLLIWAATAKGRQAKQHDNIRKNYAQRREAQANILRATLAETVEWRRAFGREDKAVDQVTAFLNLIAPDAQTSRVQDGVRRVDLTNA